MIPVRVSQAWRVAYPGAAAGFLAMRAVANPASDSALEEQKHELEQELRSRFAGWDRARLSALAPFPAYAAYYKRFKKTYHVQLQLKSLAFKGKSFPGVAALVECMFMAELKNGLLTAGHDLERVRPPLQLDVADGSQRYTLLGGQEQELKPGDMFIADEEGILSSVIYGPDQRTPILPETQRALFTVYAPPGVGAQAVSRHLGDIEAYVRLIAPQAQTELSEVYETGE